MERLWWSTIDHEVSSRSHLNSFYKDSGVKGVITKAFVVSIVHCSLYELSTVWHALQIVLAFFSLHLDGLQSGAATCDVLKQFCGSRCVGGKIFTIRRCHGTTLRSTENIWRFMLLARGTEKHNDSKIMDNIKPWRNIYNTEKDAVEYRSLNAWCSLWCRVRVRYLFAFDAFGKFWRRERRKDNIGASYSSKKHFAMRTNVGLFPWQRRDSYGRLEHMAKFDVFVVNESNFLSHTVEGGTCLQQNGCSVISQKLNFALRFSSSGL